MESFNKESGGEVKFDKNEFSIIEIDRKMALSIIVENHYLHRKCPCSHAFGLYKKDDLVGVIIYGTPASSPLRSGLCGKEEKGNVIELTRLWIRDDIQTNAASFLISGTCRKVSKEIVVSFADTSQNHTGVVYQASNWVYTGLSAKRTDWVVEGIDKHSQTLADKYTAKEIREKYGDRFSLKPRPRKHRYVFFNCSKLRRKYLSKNLRYKVVPYPIKEAL